MYSINRTHLSLLTSQEQPHPHQHHQVPTSYNSSNISNQPTSRRTSFTTSPNPNASTIAIAQLKHLAALANADPATRLDLLGSGSNSTLSQYGNQSSFGDIGVTNIGVNPNQGSSSLSRPGTATTSTTSLSRPGTAGGGVSAIAMSPLLPNLTGSTTRGPFGFVVGNPNGSGSGSGTGSGNGGTPAAPSNDDIEKVIQMATSSRAAALAGGTNPPRDTRTQLFVGNLPYRVRWQDLKDLFRRAGTVLRADVSLGPDNRSRGYGTVLLATAEDAGRAVDMFNGFEWMTRVLEVRPDRMGTLGGGSDDPSAAVGVGATAGGITGNAGNGSGGGTPGQGQTLGGFSPVNASSQFASASGAGTPFGSGVGAVSGLTVGVGGMGVATAGGRYTMSGQSSPFMSTPDYGIGAMGAAAGMPGDEDLTNLAGRSLFVGNLPFHIQWQDLKDLFRMGGGTILRADVALGADGRSRGFGMVSFASEQDAERARAMFNGYEYNGRVLKVHFDKYAGTTMGPR
ncbi:hypothetical protein QCA50_015522 [Cerrena zonata]|uniref:RRM domain-containing protein n=1 Tax=Cerrena zonata TaxID=2478898 RepID=A0AAW0FXI3_9APHY